MAKYIEQEEMQRQEEYLQKLLEYTSEFSLMHGRAPLVHTETYGCQQNENDTERIRGILKKAGFSFCEQSEAADLVIYNTCAVRENAEQKVFGRLGILKHLKESRPEMVIGLCGCMVQQEHITEKIKKTYSHVDLIFGTHALYRLPELLYQTLMSKKTVVSIENSDGAIAEDVPILREDSNKAWVSVMYGCNNFCSYCIVPYVRGRERSRKPEAILSEIRELVDSGVTEICLLGQNVNSYGKDLEEEIDFSDLLRAVNEMDGVRRIRFMTSHPKDFGDKLIDTMAECDKVCKQLHLPFQAGSDKVLADMNRRYTREEYLEKIRKVKQRIPGILLTTDVIVGFPTETNEDFQKTLDVIREVEYDQIFSFIYSRREGTPAAKMDFVLSKEEIQRNFEEMLEVQNDISKKKNLRYEGKVLEVLVEGPSKTDPNMLTGRTDTYKIVNFKGDISLVGKYVPIRIAEAHTWSLNGELVE
ncbi:MAG: tRNA (N6-isopentenyl adenosine(37)-C2)-methylthiotransferase MiaB [Ruminococcaceae bacterium]|nr:tRNA (N6-isopentenyl adenosine(37)-C2)-methylthiotransferase MiaB [Oscillospiraceae bacterium]